MSKTDVSKILEECLSVHEERDGQYGPSENNFTAIADIATKLSISGKAFTAMDVAIIMVATKAARYRYAINRINMADRDSVIHDSLIDYVNYVAIMENVRIKTTNT